MIDNWLNPDYLTDTAVARLRETFTTTPEHVVVLDDFLQAEKASALARIFDDRAHFRDYLAVQEGAEGKLVEGVDMARFEQAAPHLRRFAHWKLDWERLQHEFSINVVFLLKFHELVQHPSCREFFAKVGMTPLAGLLGQEVNSYDEEHHFLAPHSDFTDESGLCCVLYLCREWREEYGMRFQKYHNGELLRSIEPLWNRLLLFRPQAGYTHGIEPRTAAGRGWSRPGIVWWYGKA